MSKPFEEVEVKLIGLDETNLEKALCAAGATFDVVEKQTNIRINASTHPILNPSCLRIRLIEVEGRETKREFTFKQRVSTEQARVNQEYTVEISDEEVLLAILQKMGYDQFERGYKIRRRYLWKDYRIEFDRWDEASFPYPYVEVEAPDPAALDVFFDTFSIPQEAISTKSIVELKAEWQEKHRF